MVLATLLEDVIDRVLSDGTHSERLARASLAVCKASYDPVVEDGGDQVANRKLVEILGVLVFVKSVVELKVGVLHVLSDTVDLDFGLVDHHLWIGGTHRIHLACTVLFFEKRSFTHANTNVHLSGADVVEGGSNFLLTALNHLLEININVTFSGKFVLSHTLGLEGSLLLHFGAAGLTLLLDLFDTLHLNSNKN